MTATSDEVVARLRTAGCVFAEDEARLLLAEGRDGPATEAMVARRVAGEPLEQVLGWAGFAGLRIAVAPGVFVPRRRTELLVRTAGPLLHPGAVVVDLCCGTGAVGAALAAGTPLRLYAADLDPAAVECARRNVEPADGQVFSGDLYDALPHGLLGAVDLVVANAPYVPTDAVALMPPEARDHEHRLALDGGPDGLDLHRRTVAGAHRWLRPGGHLLIEAGERQAPLTAAAMTAAGLTASIVRDDDVDGTAVLGGTGDPADRSRDEG